MCLALYQPVASPHRSTHTHPTWLSYGRPLRSPYALPTHPAARSALERALVGGPDPPTRDATQRRERVLTKLARHLALLGAQFWRTRRPNVAYVERRAGDTPTTRRVRSKETGDSRKTLPFIRRPTLRLPVHQ